MAQIHNSKVIQNLIKDAKLQVSHDRVPTQLAEKIVPVLIASPTPNVNIHKKGNALNSTTATLYTTPTDKDFYLTSFFLNMVKDATATSLYTRLMITVEGGSEEAVGNISSFTLTTQEETTRMSFPLPIKLERGTTIRVTNSTNTANITSTGIIMGFTVED